MSAKNDGGPAFPAGFHPEGNSADQQGMSLRAYAAIHLRVPESKIDWLDAMITNAKRDEFAGQALAGMTANTMLISDSGGFNQKNFRACYALADAMLAERERGMR